MFYHWGQGKKIVSVWPGVRKKSHPGDRKKKFFAYCFRDIVVLFYSFFYLDSTHYVYLKWFISIKTSSWYILRYVSTKIYRSNRRKKDVTRVLRQKQAIFFLWPHERFLHRKIQWAWIFWRSFSQTKVWGPVGSFLRKAIYIALSYCWAIWYSLPLSLKRWYKTRPILCWPGFKGYHHQIWYQKWEFVDPKR